MKKLIILTIFSLIQLPLFAQKLIEKYKTGTVKLVADKEYAQSNDWNKIFRSYYDTLYNTPMAHRKSIVMLPDGSILVNHAYRNYHTKFSPKGVFQEEMQIEKGKQKAIKGVINGNTLFTGLDNMGNMTCSDLEGHFKKSLLLDYMAKNIIALPNRKFAVVGWAIHTTQFRTFIAIVDYDTNKQKIIWDKYDDQVLKPCSFQYKIKSTNGSVNIFSIPFQNDVKIGLAPLITTMDNKLIVAFPNTGKINTYNLDGKLLSTQQVTWERETLSVAEQKKAQEDAIHYFKKFAAKSNNIIKIDKSELNRVLNKMEEDIKYIRTALKKPYFTNIIKDSDGNVLIFEIPKKKGQNLFHVWIYNKNGEMSTQCSFVCEDYNLEINKDKLIFKDGYLYGLQTLKNAKGNPLRLVRFKLEN
ncbi:hypothetical protein K4L44_08090 [Halosquirtibacter laminarini]|uniref:Uncharacterized protein n=1 Tax=Halosquirtibacter laminarini TaxID=3374600 RepID=A0AC61NPD9_9BACT|nr:hypothetical protein K4L44_08090 [Prolixibacteraceae bacterium]